MQTNAECSQNKVVMVGGSDDTIIFAHFAPFFIHLRLFQSVCRTLGLFFARFFATSENQGFMLVSGLMSLSHQEASAIYTHTHTHTQQNLSFVVTPFSSQLSFTVYD